MKDLPDYPICANFLSEMIFGQRFRLSIFFQLPDFIFHPVFTEKLLGKYEHKKYFVMITKMTNCKYCNKGTAFQVRNNKGQFVYSGICRNCTPPRKYISHAIFRKFIETKTGPACIICNELCFVCVDTKGRYFTNKCHHCIDILDRLH